MELVIMYTGKVFELNRLVNIGIIPDGNRRYAVQNNIPLIKAYQIGYEKILDCVDFCIEKGVKRFAIYGLAAENFKRLSIKELLKFEEQKIRYIVNDERVHRHQIKIEIVSTEMEKLPKTMLEAIKMVYNVTEDYTKHCLSLLIGYSSQNEILQAMSKPVPKDVKSFFNKLLFPHELQMVIRTGFERRISDFLPIQSRYAEYYFLDKLWPEITQKDFKNSFDWYYSRKRNFGD